ncbi:MAG: DUF4388 domain-containing protein [Calditerrivibrio sp.]|nr:DUF4388 domain-containing protein [Calditerrivibrio sp.]
MVSKGLVGDLKAMPLTEVFQWIAFSNKNGELHLQKENDEVNIIFKNGKIVYVTSNIPHLLIGQLLLRYKMLPKNALVKGLSLQKQLKIPLGQVLIEYNFLDETSVKKILEIQVAEVVYHIITWDSGFFVFDEKEVRDSMISIPVDYLILEGLRRKDDLARFFKVFTLNSIIEVKDPENPLQEYADGKKTVGEITKEIGGDYFETYEKIYSGIINGSIKIVSEGAFIEEDDPIVKFIVALELFNKNKTYESLKSIISIINSGYQNDQIKKFYDNMVLYITKNFNNKFGGENTVFSINRLKLLDEKIYISPVEGFVLSRIEEYPTVSKLSKVVTLTKAELFLIIDKLHKLGLLLMKHQEKTKTEVMPTDVVTILLDIYKRELTGELEIINNHITTRMYFKQGKLYFLYSLTGDYSIIKFILEKHNTLIAPNDDKDDDFINFITSLLEKNNLSLSDLKTSIDVYQNMIFYETLSDDILSAIFIYDKSFPLNINTNFNILFMLLLALLNKRLKIKITIKRNTDYELLKQTDILEKEFDNIGLIKNLLQLFKDGVITSDTLVKLSDIELSGLDILYKLGYLREVEPPEVSITELQNILAELKKQTPEEIFEISNNEYDVDKIKQKFLKMSKTYHPDLINDPQGKQIAREIFELIKYSYDTLIQKKDISKSNKRIDIKNILLAEQLLTSGKVYLNMGRIHDAIESFTKAYESFSNDEEIMIYYAYALIRKNRIEEGINIMEMVGIEKFNDPELYAVIIEGYLKLNRKNEAKKYYDRAILKFPDKNKRFKIFEQKLK